MVDQLTDRQAQVLRAIEHALRDGARPPSIPELMDAMSLASPNGVAKHLRALEAKGWIARDKGARGIRLLHGAAAPRSERAEHVAYVPLVGQIAAGAPILADQNIDDLIPVPDYMAEPDAETFFLRVKGDSMIEEGILPGDLVMVSKCDSVSDGELAAVMIEDEATVKRFRRRGETVVLEPANSRYEPIVLQPGDARCAVIGRVIGLVRSYRRRL